MASDESAAGGGVIHDIGYRSYDGPRVGRRGIAAALCWQSLRAAFGFGRGAKAKIVPVIAFVIMCTPAVVNAIALALGRSHTPVVKYDTYVNTLRVLVTLLFVAVQAPELVARDLRSRVLPLYFARPIRRHDYPAAKYAAFVLACLAMIDIPVLLLYVGTIFQVHGGGQIWTQTKAMIPGLLIGLMWSLVLAAIGLALASVSGRRAFSTGAVVIFLFLTWTLALVLTRIVQAPVRPVAGLRAHAAVPASAHLFGLISPYTVMDGVRQWLGGTNPGIVANPGKYGIAYGVMLLVFLGVSLGALFARYASVSAS